MLTYKALSVATGVNAGTLKRWRHEGMPANDLSGGRVRFVLEDVSAWIERRRNEPVKLRRLRAVTFDRASLIYFARASDGLVKIGWTSNQTRRADELDIDIMATIDGDKRVEAAFHRCFADDHVDGEWFRPSQRLLAFIDGLVALQTVRVA